MVTLSPGQDNALFRISEWRRSGSQSFLLTGPAGTGKSTIAKAAGEKGTVIYVSPTGKGAEALRKRSGVDATTVHRALYKPTGGMSKKLSKLVERLLASESRKPVHAGDVKALRAELAAMRAKMGGPKWEVPETAAVKFADLVVVDECFMLSHQIISDLHKHAKKILFLGDPFQLPPIMGNSPLMDAWPDAVLSEIHRQAMENPVLAAATAVRNGQPWPMESVSNEHGSYRIISKAESAWSDYRSVEQIIVAKNATRRGFNNNCRKRTDYGGNIKVGERIMFLTNAHEMEIYNGSVGVLARVEARSDNKFEIDVTLDDGRFVPAVDVWDGVIHGMGPREAPRDYLPIDYSYAITCHKAQGSEYESVLVYDEAFGDCEMRQRWKYTALTRARTSAIVVTTT